MTVPKPRSSRRPDKELSVVTAAAFTEQEAKWLLAEAVFDARQKGATWRQIGEAAGMSTNNAHSRWASRYDSARVNGMGHERPRPMGGDETPAEPPPSILESAVVKVLQELGEQIAYPLLPTEPGKGELHLPEQKLTVIFDGLKVRVVRQKPS